MDDSWREVQLFGGAITAKLPQRFIDISDFRPVPDHQEVWADGPTDQSVVIEITEHSSVADGDAGKFIFDDMATANEASSSSISDIRQLGAADVPQLPRGAYCCLVQGTQQAAKGRDAQERSNRLLVLLCVVRLPQHGSDLLATVNAPTHISPDSSAAQQADAAGLQPEAAAQAAAVMQGLLQSLQIRDFGLFG